MALARVGREFSPALMAGPERPPPALANQILLRAIANAKLSPSADVKSTVQIGSIVSVICPVGSARCVQGAILTMNYSMHRCGVSVKAAFLLESKVIHRLAKH
jgi:hypothetical protein